MRPIRHHPYRNTSPAAISVAKLRPFITKFPVFLLVANLACPPASTEDKVRSPRRTMAHSVASPSYERERLPNGEWKAETYALGIGQTLGPTESDESLSALSFEEMAEIIAEALYRENFIPETDPGKTDLMIVVNWGKTVPYSDGFRQTSVDGMANAMNAVGDTTLDVGNADSSSGSLSSQSVAELETMLLIQDMSERARRQANDYNAQLLGFAPELHDHYVSDPLGGPQRSLLDELEEEVEAERYFVILQAFDFQKLTQSKTADLLWITRFSIRAKGRQFDQEFGDMAKAAARLFGTNSGKLKRNLLPGTATPGELEVIDVIEDDSSAPK